MLRPSIPHLRRPYRPDLRGGRDCGVRLLRQRRPEPDRGGRAKLRLPSAATSRPRRPHAHPTARLLQYSAAVYRASSWAPLALAMAHVSPWLALGASLAIYATAQILGVALPSLAGTRELVFQSFRLAARFHPWHRRLRSLARPANSEVSDPLLDLGGRVDRRRIRRDRRILEAPGHPRQLVRASGSVEGRSRLRQAGAFRRTGVFRLPDPVATVERTMIGRELQRLGRYSLPIFAFGSILSCAAQVVMQAAKRKFLIGWPQLVLSTRCSVY